MKQNIDYKQENKRDVTNHMIYRLVSQDQLKSDLLCSYIYERKNMESCVPYIKVIDENHLVEMFQKV